MLQNRLSSIALTLALFLCASCASDPRDRRGPPQERGGSAGASYTGMAAKPISVLFASMDVDRDAVVDAAELTLGTDVEWLRLSNGGPVSALGFEAWSIDVLGSKDTLPSFVAFDRDLDGAITPDEFSVRLRTEFSALDSDKNGRLERSELVFRISRAMRDSGGSEQGQRQRGEERGRGGPQR